MEIPSSITRKGMLNAEINGFDFATPSNTRQSKIGELTKRWRLREGC
jgi:hypothetical protein